MKYIPLFLLLILSIGSCKKKDDTTPQTRTRTVNLKLDGFETGEPVGFQAGFIAGETAEVTLGPVNNTFQITHVQFLFGGSGSNPVTRDIVLRINKDIGVGTPGAFIFSKTYSIAASDNLLQQIDLSDENIIVNGGGSIRIAIEMTAGGLPSVAVDKDGTIASASNWIKTASTWFSSSSLGLTGDFIIRAKVQENY